MELIYSTRQRDFEPGKHYRNPDYFDRPETRATSVVLDGDYPKVRDAYEALNVPVSAAQDEAQADAQPETENATDDEREALAAEYEARFGKKPGKMKTETIRDKLSEE